MILIFNNTQIDNDFTIRIKLFKGYSKNGTAKYHKRRSLTAKGLACVFSERKVAWWYEKAILQDKPFTATKKEHYMVTFYKRWVR